MSPHWEVLARDAAATEPTTAPGRRRELLVFALDGGSYAVPVDRVFEIVRMRPVTPVPGTPSEVCGVISLRGAILQVVDARRCLGLAPREPDRSARIVVLHDDGEIAAGLLVDSVEGVIGVDACDLLPPPGESGSVEWLCASDGRFVSVLGVDPVLELSDAG